MSKEKITISEIIDLMAAKTNSSKKQTEEFVKTLMSTVEDTLIEGEIVKIKDLGTFKPQWNEPRKSVDVNTGDEITIPGYYKVVFLPDNEFKELVNKPYSHLEPIEQKTPLALKEKDIEPEKKVETSKSEKKEEEVKIHVQPDGSKVVMEPMRMFEEQATQIKGILYEIEALSGKPSKLPPKQDDAEPLLAGVNTPKRITPYSVSSILSDDKKGDDTELNGDNTQYTYTFEDTKTRKYRKKLEREERKERTREQIKQYFNDNKFDLVREVKVEEKDEIIFENQNIADVEVEQKETKTPEELSHTILDTLTENIGVEETSAEPITIEEFNDEASSEVELVTETTEKKLPTKPDAEEKKDVNVIVNLIVNQGEDGKLQIKEAPKSMKEELVETPIVATSEQLDTPVVEEEKPKTIENEQPVISANNEDVDYTFVQIRKKRNRIWLFIVTPILMALIGFGVWYFFPTIKSFIKPYWESYFPTDKDQTIKEVPTSTVAKTNTATTSDSIKTQTPDTLTTEELFKKERDYKEFIASEVLKPGTQLSALAKKYLNHPYFWIYIYEANIDVIEDPNHIPIGTVIKIPKMDSRLINVNNPECLKYAEKLANEYLYYDNK